MKIIDIAEPKARPVKKASNNSNTLSKATVSSIHQKKKMIAFENAKKNLKVAASKLDW
ncbi:hypothetical protein [Celerinatantimonas sp. MCCC 1A17872]|uniref:hypothetical protein n=1 Tax=Celerinatantimonas sp. MCCC 1A17872 TaxID=3177514 RepID=UPI0038C85D46